MGRVVVTGGAGFLGSHLCQQLLARGDSVVCVDNLVTGDRSNVAPFLDDPGFSFVEQDISDPFTIDGPVDAVLNFASPASPPDYLRLPIETLKVGSLGTMHALELARDKGARFLTASTSEVYGDPHVHPQTESYWGNVNPVGPRSVYDEAKRFGEALTMAFHRTHGVDTRLVRIFNTYGPNMRAGDGRVVSNFIVQALTGQPITIYGKGDQTRSFCYVDDEVRGFLALLGADGIHDPVNIGNPNEFTILELAEVVLDVIDTRSELVYEPLPQDDPTQRKPDITRATELLQWEPVVQLREGVTRTAEFFARRLGV
jgi:nucleoside-diphosphate-sugar epimerase